MDENASDDPRRFIGLTLKDIYIGLDHDYLTLSFEGTDAQMHIYTHDEGGLDARVLGPHHPQPPT